MVPDFEYLFRLQPSSRWSHTLPGLLTFCLPIGLIAVTLWYALLRRPMRELFALRFEELELPPWTANWWLRCALAVVFGAATHLAWDGFTHEAGWAMALIPALHRTALVLRGYHMPWFRLLQHGSTVVGGLVVLRWLWPQLAATQALRRIARTAWRLLAIFGIGACALLVALWNVVRGISTSGGTATVTLAARLAVGGLVGIVIGLILFSVWYRVASPAPDEPFPAPQA